MATLSEEARYRAALRRLQAKLVRELAADEDDARFISREAELLVLALLCVLRDTLAMPQTSRRCETSETVGSNRVPGITGWRWM